MFRGNTSGTSGAVYSSAIPMTCAIKSISMESQKDPSDHEFFCKAEFDRSRSKRRQDFITWLSTAESVHILKRLQSECDSMSLVRHHAIPPITRQGKIDLWGSGKKLDFFETEFIDGDTLDKYRKASLRKQGLPDMKNIQEVIACSYRLASAIAALHDHKLTHRDIKPSNVMIPAGKTAVDCLLIDLGLARLEGGSKHSLVSGVRIRCGTPAYMPDEQLNPDPSYAAQEYLVDQFSLGVLMYVWLTDEFPYPTPQQKKPSSGFVPEPSSSRNSKVPPALSSLIDRMISRSPNDRFSCIRDVMAHLEKLAPAWHVKIPDEVRSVTSILTTSRQLGDLRYIAQRIIRSMTAHRRELLLSDDPKKIEFIANSFRRKYEFAIRTVCNDRQFLVAKPEIEVFSNLEEIMIECDKDSPTIGIGLSRLIERTLSSWGELDLDLARKES